MEAKRWGDCESTFHPSSLCVPSPQGQKPALSGYTGPDHFSIQIPPIPGSYPPCSSLFRYSSRSSAGRAPQPRAWYSRNNSDTSICCLGELRPSVPERQADTITWGLLSQPSSISLGMVWRKRSRAFPFLFLANPGLLTSLRGASAETTAL